MSATNWNRQYGPTVTPDSAIHVILPAVTYKQILTKFTVSNVSGAVSTATVTITPSGGAPVAVLVRQVPAQPTQGGIAELVELEGQILNAGDTLSFTDSAGAALAPMISIVQYVP